MIQQILAGRAGTTHRSVALQAAVPLAQSHDAEVTGTTVREPTRMCCEGVSLLKSPDRGPDSH
jgi:hypothetical protein